MVEPHIYNGLIRHGDDAESGNGKLGSLLREIKRENKIGLGDLTVLSAQNDPFRIDTETFHVAGRWFRDQMAACGLLARANPIHNRGIHYAIVSRGDVMKPDGSPYLNDADSWAFLERQASKAARWLGYVPFEKIIDARNGEPIIRVVDADGPKARVRVEAEWYLPDAEDLKPRVELSGFTPRQPYRLVLFGEKTSLGEVLDPLATEYGADLYLPSGEISDTWLARMARTGAEDGREMVVMVLADCDPAGYQMAVSIAHKLRALRETLYACLNFRVLTPALTVEQVKELGLPSTPLKETELRAAGWRSKHGVEQTEIDALATLAPDRLRKIVRDAVAPFYDRSLARRARAAKSEWEEAAQAAFDEQVDQQFLDSIRSRAETDLTALRERMRELETVVDDINFDFPPIVMPEPVLDGTPAEALVSSNMSLLDAIQILRERKRYSGDDGGGA
jgi:hypothetical protein